MTRNDFIDSHGNFEKKNIIKSAVNIRRYKDNLEV